MVRLLSIETPGLTAARTELVNAKQGVSEYEEGRGRVSHPRSHSADSVPPNLVATLVTQQRMGQEQAC